MSLSFLFYSLISWLMDFYIRRLVCLQFCAFKKAGSNFSYTHVHLLRKNDRQAAGLGHDDAVPNDHEGHVVVTDKDGTKSQAEDEGSMALRDFETSLTAYFHQKTGEGDCEDGYRSFKCTCARGEGETEEVWVCYTLDYRIFMQRYETLEFPNKIGKYVYPYEGVGVDLSHFRLELACGSSVVLRCVQRKSHLPSCDGWGGPADGENQLIKDARTQLQKAVDQIKCGEGCTKSARETFKAWRCVDTKLDGLMAHVSVQWTVECKRP
jgi:hypothetical protein